VLHFLPFQFSSFHCSKSTGAQINLKWGFTDHVNFSLLFHYLNSYLQCNTTLYSKCRTVGGLK
jgi:hypothetical protein